MLTDQPLVSVIIVAYKNYDVIYDAINSTLNQDYPNIELIISNDGSDDFDIGEIKKLFSDYKDRLPNLARVLIRNNSTNVGTVKHVNQAVSQCNGKYFKLLAADDIFLCDNAITQYVEYMEAHQDAYFVVAQSAAYSNDLTEFLRYIPSDEQMHLLQTATAEQQFHILAKDCIINAPAVFFARKYITDFGYFDDRYFFADDWPAWISFTRNGNQIQVLNKVLVVYRFGGISNTNVYNAKNIANRVLDEYFQIMKNEGIRYYKQLGWKDTYICRKLCYEYSLSKKNTPRWKTILKNLDIFIIKKANFIRKNAHLKFLTLIFSMSLLTFSSLLKLIASSNPLLNSAVSLLQTISIIVFGITILFHFLCFIFDLSR